MKFLKAENDKAVYIMCLAGLFQLSEKPCLYLEFDSKKRDYREMTPLEESLARIKYKSELADIDKIIQQVLNFKDGLKV